MDCPETLVVHKAPNNSFASGCWPEWVLTTIFIQNRQDALTKRHGRDTTKAPLMLNVVASQIWDISQPSSECILYLWMGLTHSDTQGLLAALLPALPSKSLEYSPSAKRSVSLPISNTVHTSE